MNILPKLMMAIIFASTLSETAQLQADPHGHIIYRDQDGCCTEGDEDDDDDDYEDECCLNDGTHHAWARNPNAIEPGFEDDDITQELEDDTSWPSRRENFSEMFR